MARVHLIAPVLILSATILGSEAADAAPRAGSGPGVPTTQTRPDAYGATAYTVTSLSALAFTTSETGKTYASFPGDFFRYFTGGAGDAIFVTGAVIPAGAVIDYVGLGSCDPGGGAFQVFIYEVADGGAFGQIAAFPSAAHACATDYNPEPLAYPIFGNAARTIQVAVEQASGAPVDGSARFSSVEIWWRRQVSPGPPAATFGDVPTDHPFFQFIEALALSGITVGCGGGDYCPGNPLTRGQMAVFLAKALGLHWPGSPD